MRNDLIPLANIVFVDLSTIMKLNDHGKCNTANFFEKERFADIDEYENCVESILDENSQLLQKKARLNSHYPQNNQDILNGKSYHVYNKNCYIFYFIILSSR